MFIEGVYEDIFTFAKKIGVKMQNSYFVIWKLVKW